MNKTNQGTCQSRKTAENWSPSVRMADFPNQELVRNPKPQLGTFAARPALMPAKDQEGVCVMIGKLFGAWLGEKVAGRNKGAKGAILGYGAAALAKRSVPLLATAALGGWAWKKWREHKRSDPSYPSEATPFSD